VTALSRLAGNVEDLAGTCAEVNAGLRGRLLLDGPDQQSVIDHQADETNGNGTGRRKRQTA
jgi:hypothetical protein